MPASDSTDVLDIESVLIIGGGDVGLLTALQLDTNVPDITVRVVDDFSEDVSNIGKSTYYAIKNVLFEGCDISRNRFISEVQPVWKLSIDFQEWFGCERFHAPFDSSNLFTTESEQDRNYEGLYRYKTNTLQTLGVHLAEKEKSPFLRREDGTLSQPYQGTAFHLSTESFNPFLRKLCRERGIELVDDRITDVNVSNNNIHHIESSTARYYSDLYVDASGFSRVLFNNLDVEYERYPLLLDSAVATTIPLELSDIRPSTVVKSQNSGWIWQIDTTDGRDIGYVYSSDHTTTEDAIKTLQTEYQDSVGAEMREYSFTSGTFESAWVGNCVAVGNAYGFVEPLQSTALTTAGITARKLAKYITSHSGLISRGTAKQFNREITSNWENINKTLQMHYKYAPKRDQEPEFITDMRNATSQTQFEASDIYNGNGILTGGLEGKYSRLINGDYTFNAEFLTHLYAQFGIQSQYYEDLIANDTNIPRHIRDAVKQNNTALKQNTGEYLTYDDFYTLTLPEALPRET